ncbi:hypothetical protein, partial [Azotobacter beijerinckii]|uniref:hypothetical protein n=1 Tax=Azotobacter beijerinckii TaxID=170623 RepID=UPI001B8D1D6B
LQKRSFSRVLCEKAARASAGLARVILENRSRKGVPPKPSFEKPRNAVSGSSHPTQSRAVTELRIPSNALFSVF